MIRILPILLIVCGPFALADAEPPAPLRVMAYNIKHGRGMDGKVDLNRIAAVIGAQKPDLVALQEVDKNCTRSGKQDLAALLGERLGMEHRFAKFMDFQGGEYGLAVLSRFPIRHTARHVLPRGAEPRAVLEIQIRPEGFRSPLSFVSLHHDWTSPEFRVQQVTALHAALRERPHPVILAGDFNSEAGGPSMKLLVKNGWTIVPKDVAEARFTFPSDEPRKEIDFFVTRNMPGVRITHEVVDERVASDHRPITATVTLAGKDGK